MKNYPITLTATDRTKSAFKSVSKSVKGLTGTLGKLSGLTGVLSGASLAGLGAMAVKAGEAAAEVNKLTSIAGVSSEAFQKMAHGASVYGIEQEKLSDILKDTNDKIGDFMSTGGGPLKDFFDNVAPKVGVTAESFKNLSSDQALGLYVSSLEKANLSQADMTFYMEAIASDSTALLPLLRDNGSELNKFAGEAERLGIVLSDIELIKLEEANKSFARTKKTVSTFSSLIASRFAPVIESLSNKFLDAAKEAGGLNVVANKVMKFLVKAVGYAANAVQGLVIVWKAVKKGALAAVTGVINAVAAMDRGLTKFINKFTPFSAEINHELTLLSGKLMLMSEEAGENLNNALNQDLNSDKINEWYENLVVTSQRAAAVIANDKSMALTSSIQAPGTSEDDEESPEKTFIDRQRDAAKTYNEIWDESFQTFNKGVGDSVASAIVDNQNLAEGLRGVMRNVAKSVIAGLVQIGVRKAALWAMEKAGMATSTALGVAAATATSAAWSVPAALVSLATFGANSVPATTGIATTVAMSKGLSLMGVAHDGLSSVPTDGTYLLQKGEKVVNNRDSKKMDKMLENGGGDTINVNVNLNAIDTKSGHEYLNQMAGSIVSIIRSERNNRAMSF